MKKYPHQVFLAENKLKTEQLPKQLQKRIKGFEELQEDLEHALDDDHDRLAKKLDHLSLELEEDLYEEFEDQLENNEEQDDLQPGSLYSFSDGFTWKIVSKKEAKALFNKNQVQKTGIVYHPQRIKVSIVRRVKVSHPQRVKVNH